MGVEDVKIATWNMANRKGAWDYLRDVIDPDYALLQEAQVIDTTPGHARWMAIGPNSMKVRIEGAVPLGHSRLVAASRTGGSTAREPRRLGTSRACPRK